MPLVAPVTRATLPLRSTMAAARLAVLLVQLLLPPLALPLLPAPRVLVLGGWVEAACRGSFRIDYC